MDNLPSQTISIDSGTIVRFLLFVSLFIILYLLRDVVLILLTSVVLASAIEPATQWFRRRGVPRVAGVLIIYLTVGLLLATIVYFFFPPLLQDVSNILSQLPEYASSLELNGGEEGLLGNDLGVSTTLAEVIREFQGSVAQWSGSVVTFASSLFGGILSGILIIVFSFYLAVQENGIASFLRVVTPYRYEAYIIDLWKRSQFKIGRWLQGQLLLSLMVGILSYLGLMILGVPNALLLAIVAALFELIPLFGPIIASVPAIAIALIDGGITLGLMTAGLFIIVQQFENHLLHPLVVKKVVGVPAVVVIVALLIGGNLAGFLGVILAVPMAAALMEYIADIERRKSEYRHAHSTNPST